MYATYAMVTICSNREKNAQAVGNMYKFVFHLNKMEEPFR